MVSPLKGPLSWDFLPLVFCIKQFQHRPAKHIPANLQDFARKRTKATERCKWCRWESDYVATNAGKSDSLVKWKQSCALILEQSMGVRNRVGIGLPYRPTRLHRLANRFLEFDCWPPYKFKNAVSDKFWMKLDNLDSMVSAKPENSTKQESSWRNQKFQRYCCK